MATAGRRRRKIEMDTTANARVKMVQMAAAAAHCTEVKGRDSTERMEIAGMGNGKLGSTVDCDQRKSERADRKVNINKRIMTAATAAARRRNKQKKNENNVAETAAAGSSGRLEPICCRIALVDPWGLEMKAMAALKEEEDPNMAADTLELAAAAATEVRDGKHLLESGVVGNDR
jgi:hypothetical protein